MLVFGIILLSAAVVVFWSIIRPSEGSLIPGSEIPILLYATTLLIGGIFAVAGLSWSLWPAGLWLMIGGGSIATVGLAFFAWISRGAVGALMAFGIGSLVALVGPFGLGIAYVIQHLHITWV